MICEFELDIDNQSSSQDMMKCRRQIADLICEMEFVAEEKSSHLISNWHHVEFGNIGINYFKNNKSLHVVHKAGLSPLSQNNSYELVICDSPMILKHYNRTTSVVAFSFVLLDNKEPFDFKICNDSSSGLSIHLETKWLQQWIPNPKSFVTKVFSSNSGWGEVLLKSLSTIESQNNSKVTISNDVIEQQLGSLLSLILLQSDDNEMHTRHQTNLYTRLQRSIISNYYDPDLSPELVAKEASISKRHLYNIFSKAGTTFGKELISVRLHKAHTMLIGNMFNSYKVCDVAWACGFSDTSHFSRRFKELFDCSPSKFRNENKVI